jgi:hypothetical protein
MQQHARPKVKLSRMRKAHLASIQFLIAAVTPDPSRYLEEDQKRKHKILSNQKNFEEFGMRHILMYLYHLKSQLLK